MRKLQGTIGLNKLAKAQETRKSPGTLGLKKFGPGKLQVEKVWAKTDEFSEFFWTAFDPLPAPFSGNFF